jgi:hypothetical protein
MKAHSNKAADEAREQAASAAEMAEALGKSFEQTLRAGLKFHEEAGRWWTSALHSGTCAQHWQEQLHTATHTANSLLPLAQEHMEATMDLAQKNSRAGAELIKKALSASQSPGVAAGQAKWTEVWTDSLDLAKSNAETLWQIGAKSVNSWTKIVRSNVEAAVSAQ